jgi:hypothetical protein
MKLRKILGLALCALVFSFGAASCSDDDDNNGGNNGVTELSGTWKYSKTSADVEVKNSEIKDKVVAAIEKMEDAVDNTYAFKLDGTFGAKKTVEGEIKDVKGTYKLKDDKLTLTVDKETETLSYKDGKISTSVDVKAEIAKQLDIDEADITRAVRIDTFGKITK